MPARCSPKSVVLLALAILLGVAACASDESPTAPSPVPNLETTTTGAYHAVTLSGLGGGFAIAIAINRYGIIVGSAVNSSANERAVRWKNRVIQDLGTLGGKTSKALALNNHGQIVGYSERADGKVHAFLWYNGVRTDLGTPGGSNSAAYGIDRDGRVLVGGSDGSVGIWANGVITRLPLPPNSPGCSPTGMDPAAAPSHSAWSARTSRRTCGVPMVASIWGVWAGTRPARRRSTPPVTSSA